MKNRIGGSDMLLPQNVSPSWEGFLTRDILKELDNIEMAIDDNYTPAKGRILRILSTDLKKAKVCILGQDAYFQSGVATGRAFEVNSLNSWNSKFRQVSLKNIVRLIHKSYKEIEEYENIRKFSDILKEIDDGSFPIITPNKLFESYEKQGVLLLNTYLTCEINKPNSHRNIWKQFSIKLLNFISIKKPNLMWFLWGNEAISQRQYIGNGVFFESRHPMLCSSKYDNDFLKSNCFKDTMKTINWLG